MVKLMILTRNQNNEFSHKPNEELVITEKVAFWNAQ